MRNMRRALLSLVAFVLAGLASGCVGTMCALNSGSYIATAKSYDAAYLVDDRLILSYTASVEPDQFHGMLVPSHAPKYTVPAWAIISTKGLAASAHIRDSGGYIKDIEVTDVHLSKLPPGMVTSAQAVPIVVVGDPWMFDCSKTSPDD